MLIMDAACRVAYEVARGGGDFATKSFYVPSLDSSVLFNPQERRPSQSRQYLACRSPRTLSSDDAALGSHLGSPYSALCLSDLPQDPIL